MAAKKIQATTTYPDFAATALSGAAFGAALTASGVYLPSVIIDQFRLTDFHMFQVFATAVGSSAIIMLVLERLDVVTRPVKSNSTLGIFSTHYDGNVVGGALIGVGMALSGACPGTVLVQLAHGIPSASPTAAGALAGAGAYVKTKHLFTDTTKSAGTSDFSAQKTTISEATRIPEVVVYVLFGAAVAAVLRFTRAGATSSLVSPIVGGLLISSAQAISLLLTYGPLGASMVYEQVSRKIMQVFEGSWKTLASPHKSMIFSLGVIAGSTFLLQRSSTPAYSAADASIPAVHAFVGGTVMAFGARLAGGCTSGHGLSGLSAMSFSSVVTVAGIFGAGILTRWLM